MVLALPETQASMEGHSMDSSHRSADLKHLTLTLVAAPGRSADLTTEAWPATFPLADDQASVEGSMGAGAFTVVEPSMAAEAAGNWRLLERRHLPIWRGKLWR